MLSARPSLHTEVNPLEKETEYTFRALRILLSIPIEAILLCPIAHNIRIPLYSLQGAVTYIFTFDVSMQHLEICNITTKL